MGTEDELETFEIYEGTAWEVALLKSILDDNEIESIMRDASFASWNLYPARAGTVKIFVAQKDFERAVKITGEFRANMQKENPEDTGDES
ncbi:MAG TPA: DUF2007 domain-containing protein [Bacteroidales bacterium]|nr:DUF2007 domain-containing protein [Bacteroidales bacterium]HPT02771.1 DUF2007 domain-containing protein [Bacteroidales bacterium]